MSEFVNRMGTNLNRKVFDVESVQRDGTGEIIQIIGNLFRNDSEGLTQEGTPLEASELNSVVKDIAYNERREISALTIMNASNTVVFSMGQSTDKKIKGKIDSMLPTAKNRELEQELKRTGVAIETVLERYHLESVEQMTEEIYEMAIRGLRKSKTKEAA